MPTDYPRIAVITGATSGIGEATARRFIDTGYAVVGNGRSADKLAALEKELGPAFCPVPGDAYEDEVIEALFTAATDRYNKPADIVVVNAGRGMGGSVKDGDLSQFEQILRTNVAGAVKLLQKAARAFVALQENNFPESAADIIVLGSVSGRHISPFSAVYGSSKFAVHSLAESLRREIAPKGVRVSLIEPGIVLSGFQAVAGYDDDLLNKFETDFGPLLVGEDVANAIGYIVNQPPHVHVGDIVVRPTRQGYP